jgi:hypothetical protein
MMPDIRPQVSLITEVNSHIELTPSGLQTKLSTLSAESSDRYSSHLVFFLEMNTTTETIVEEEEDIIYQKDASFSAELDTSGDVRGNSVISPPTVDDVEKKVQFLTTQSPNLEQKVPGSTPSDGHTTESLRAADTTPCLLDCGVGGSCTSEPVDLSGPGQQRCQCPLGRGGNRCESGKYRKKCCYNCFCKLCGRKFSVSADNG